MADRKPYWWVSPNPAGVSRELMTLEALTEFMRTFDTYAVPGEGIEATFVLLTDEEVAALPEV